MRAGKGDEDRVAVGPEPLAERLRAHQDRVRGFFEQERGAGLTGVGFRSSSRTGEKAGAWDHSKKSSSAAKRRTARLQGLAMAQPLPLR